VFSLIRKTLLKKTTKTVNKQGEKTMNIPKLEEGCCECYTHDDSTSWCAKNHWTKTSVQARDNALADETEEELMGEHFCVHCSGDTRNESKESCQCFLKKIRRVLRGEK
jgi:hypothetical protein